MPVIERLFEVGPFIPHGHCYLWNPNLVGLHLVSDALIALAYYSIPLTLVYFVRRRKDLPFNAIFWMFSLFIVACGTTHLLAIWTLWHPAYWLSGSVKALTAGISVFTAIELVPIVPQALALPSPAILEQANQALQAEIAERIKVEQELKRYQSQLEELVAERTEQLEASNHQMEGLLEAAQAAQGFAERSRAEIERYAERLTLALDAAQMGSWDWDLTTDAVLWTPTQEQIFGYEPGKPDRTYEDWKCRVHPDDLAETEAQIEAAIANCGAELICEYRIVLPTGEQRWVDTYGRCYRGEDGKALRMVGVVSDITARHQSDQALRHSEQTAQRQFSEIEAIYDTTPIGLCVLDTEARYVRINQHLADINGLSIAEHAGRTVQDLLPDIWETLQIYFYRALETGDPILNTEIWGSTLARQGDDRVWLVSFCPIKDEGGQVWAMNLTAQEITERKRTERALQERASELVKVNRLLSGATHQLRKRNQELDQFAYVVSHDLKAPLRAIANLSEWLEEDLGKDLSDDSKDLLHLMRLRVYRMEALINGLLEYSRVGRVETTTSEVNIQVLLEELIDSLAPPEGFQVTIDSPMPTFKVKRILLEQVFSNLISNGIKHHGNTVGHISIHCADGGDDFYEFWVTDDGPGIDSGYHTKIFTIFQTLKPRDEQENTGIGLSIVKKIVEEGGGTITVESTVGQGTTFRFTWPKYPKG